MLLRMLAASEEATSGSVMQKQDRISPSSNGTSHSSCCSAVPNSASTSMFPVSGAEQLSASGAMGLRPVISASGAYSRLVRPAPHFSLGRKRFQRPRLRASCLRSSITGGWKCGSPEAATWSRYTASAGYTWLSMNSRSLDRSSSVRFERVNSTPRTLPGGLLLGLGPPAPRGQLFPQLVVVRPQLPQALLDG